MSLCECYEGDRCVECGGCDCPDNPSRCPAGCVSLDDAELLAEECGDR